MNMKLVFYVFFAEPLQLIKNDMNIRNAHNYE